MTDQCHCYIGRLQAAEEHYAAGTVVAAICDSPNFAKQCAKVVAEWVRTGLTVEHVPLEWARQFLFTAEQYRGR